MFGEYAVSLRAHTVRDWVGFRWERLPYSKQWERKHLARAHLGPNRMPTPKGVKIEKGFRAGEWDEVPIWKSILFRILCNRFFEAIV